MPAQEETGSVVIKTWVLDIGLDVTTRRHPNLPAAQQLRMQVDIPDRPRDPILIDSFGARVRAITMDGVLVSIERLPAEEG